MLPAEPRRRSSGPPPLMLPRIEPRAIRPSTAISLDTPPALVEALVTPAVARVFGENRLDGDVVAVLGHLHFVLGEDLRGGAQLADHVANLVSHGIPRERTGALAAGGVTGVGRGWHAYDARQPPCGSLRRL